MGAYGSPEHLDYIQNNHPSGNRNNKLRKCPKCGAKVTSEFCPICGSPMKRRSIFTRWWFWVAAFAVLLIVVGSANAPKSAAPPLPTLAKSRVPAAPSVASWKTEFKVSNVKQALDPSLDTLYLTGTVENLTDTDFNYVQISLNLYDSSGAQVDSVMANIANLEAKGTWKFQTYASVKDVSSYKVVDITAF